MAEGTFSERDLSLLSAYLDGELSEGERTRLEARLAREPALQDELESLRQTVAMVRSLPEVRPPRSFTLDPATYGRRAPGGRWFSLATSLIATGASLMLVAACASVLLLGRVGFGTQQLAAPAAAPLAEEGRELAQSEAAAEEEAPALEAPAEEAPAQADAVEEAGELQEEEAAAEIAPEPQATPGIGLAAPAAPAEAEAFSGAGGEGERAVEPEAGGLGGGGAAEAEAQPAEVPPPAGQAQPAATATQAPASTLPTAPTQISEGLEATEIAGLPAPAEGQAENGALPQGEAVQGSRPYFLTGVAIGVVAVLGVLLFSLGLGLALARRRA